VRHDLVTLARVHVAEPAHALPVYLGHDLLAPVAQIRVAGSVGSSVSAFASAAG
jgi:hypothetical protein